MKKLFTLESLLVRFGVRMLCMSHSECALSVYRMAIEEAGHAETGQVFYESGPADWIRLLEALLSKAMLRGELPPSDPQLAACQLMALVMAETRSRLYQPAPPPLTPRQMRSMARRAVETFLIGAAAVSSR
jgi:hypothetical protein